MITLQYQVLDLTLEFVFAISRWGKAHTQTVLLEPTTVWQGQTIQGIGEAVPEKFYGETVETVQAFYQQIMVDGVLSDLTPFDIQKLTQRLNQYKGHMAAKSGLDMAFYDMQGKILGLPLYQLWGLDPSQAPKSSYTIGLCDLDEVRHKTTVALSRGYDVLKVKLGSTHDRETLDIVRELAPNATIRTDANAGLTLKQAMVLAKDMVSKQVEFVEEPLTLDSPEADYITLKAEYPIPVMADESCKTLGDIPRCAQLFDAINLKHTKTGGLTEALRMIHAARAHNLKIMLGGFSETSVSVTAFGHLSPLVDYADLDAALLLAHDPYDGIAFNGSQIVLPKRPGIGVIPRST